MVQVDNGDGKTRETAIKIMSAEDRHEGWEYISEYLKQRWPATWDKEFSTITAEDGFEYQFVLYKSHGKKIWFDWTWLYYFMR